MSAGKKLAAACLKLRNNSSGACYTAFLFLFFRLLLVHCCFIHFLGNLWLQRHEGMNKNFSCCGLLCVETLSSRCLRRTYWRRIYYPFIRMHCIHSIVINIYTNYCNYIHCNLINNCNYIHCNEIHCNYILYATQKSHVNN